MPTRGKKKTTRNKTARNKNAFSIQRCKRDVVVEFLTILNTVKLFHWKTYSYPTHKATDELYSKLNEHIDEFVEVMLGKKGDRVNLTSVKKIPLKDFENQLQLKREMEKFKVFLHSLTMSRLVDDPENSDLMSIRDDILAVINQFLYLLTFK